MACKISDLKYWGLCGEHIISTSESLSEFDQIARLPCGMRSAVRELEVVHARIQTVKPKLTYDHDQL